METTIGGAVVGVGVAIVAATLVSAIGAVARETAKTTIGGAVVGVGVAIVAATIVEAIVAVARPLAKEVIKGGIIAYTAVSELVAGAGEECSDLVAEAKAEAGQPKSN